MAHKFKVGELVRVVMDDRENPGGDVGVVSIVDSDLVEVRFDDWDHGKPWHKEWWFVASALEPVVVAPKFKVGDRVRVLSRPRLWTPEEGVVKSVNYGLVIVEFAGWNAGYDAGIGDGSLSRWALHPYYLEPWVAATPPRYIISNTAGVFDDEETAIGAAKIRARGDVPLYVARVVAAGLGGDDHSHQSREGLMAKSLASLRRVTAVNPPSMVAYGVHGVGKTSFAAEWPNPVFIQCEQGTPGGLELDTFGEIESFSDVLDAIGTLLTEPHDFKTVVIDSLDAMEPLVWAHVCAENKWDTIESPGFGKGYVMVDAPWRDFLAACHALTCAGVSVVQIAHSDIVRFDSPTTDPYSRYGVKLHKRAAALVQEAADIVGFFNYRINLKQADVGFKKVSHGEGGGTRLIHLEERPGFLAKNRYKMPSQVEYKPGEGFSIISKYFPQPTGVSVQQRSAA